MLLEIFDNGGRLEGSISSPKLKPFTKEWIQSMIANQKGKSFKWTRRRGEDITCLREMRILLEEEVEGLDKDLKLEDLEGKRIDYKVLIAGYPELTFHAELELEGEVTILTAFCRDFKEFVSEHLYLREDDRSSMYALIMELTRMIVDDIEIYKPELYI